MYRSNVVLVVIIDVTVRTVDGALVSVLWYLYVFLLYFFFQAEDGIRDTEL